MKTPVHAQVHRFRDAVGLYVGTGETVYISAKDARKIAKALQTVARSCDRETFVESTCGTHSFEMESAK